MKSRWIKNVGKDNWTYPVLFREVEVSEPKEVGWWVLQWGAEAEVLKPESLRRELQETAKRLLTLYRGNISD